MKKALFCLALVGLCASLTFAEKGTPVTANVGQKVAPLSYQRIGSDMKPIGPVYPYGNGGIAQADVLAFDCFGPDAAGFPSDGNYGADCAMGSSRWYLTSGTLYYDNPHHAFDIHTSPGAEGKMATRFEFAWLDARPAAERFIVIQWPIEDYDASCIGPAFTTTYDGIMFDFGVIGGGPPTGYFYTDITGVTIPFQLPMDNVGGIITVYSQEVTTTAIYLTTPACQPMLWGSFDPACVPAGTNTNFQITTQWDDDNPLDGTFGYPPAALECYGYNFGVCPDPLGAMYCYYYTGGGGGLRCDANCDNYFDGFDIDPFFLLLQSVDDWIAAGYTCDPTMAGDANCDNYVDGFDIDPFFAGIEVGECICP